MFDQASQKAEQTLAMLRDASQNGAIPIYCDTSPCVMRLKEHLAAQDESLPLYEPVDFIHGHVLATPDPDTKT